jgi:ADP-ribose pyrophosphatase
MAKQRIKIGKWKTVFKGFFHTIKQAPAKYPDGRVKIWERSFRIPTVAILAFNKDGKFLLIREFQDDNQKYEWRVPAGRVEYSNLTIKQHAQKELREETGFSGGKLKKFMTWHSGGWDLHVFWATDLKNNPLANDEYEDIRVYFLPLSKVYQMCLKGKINNAHIIASIILLYDQIKKGKIKI